MARLTNPKTSKTNRLISFFGSRLFFWIVVAIFVLQASWIALSARYPQAFDEQFHFGIIQIYAHHLSPFLSQQPANANQYGAVYRDPSYLYHYVMSFPYRLLTHCTASQTTQIIVLRLMNVVMLASSLFIFKKILRKIPISDAMSNVVLAFLVLLPVFPLLGAEINYDNLFIPLSGLAIYWTMELIQAIKQRHVFSWSKVVRLGVLCLLTSLIKYPFLPIFLALMLCAFWTWLKTRKHGLHYEVAKNTGARVRLVVLGLLLLMSLGLFVQRDGINTLNYDTPIPECDQVLTIQQCMAYGPWARNYNIAQTHIHLPAWQVATFPFVWLYHTMGELVFTISSSFNNGGTVDYHTGSQLIIIEIVTWGVFGIGLLLVILQSRYIWRQPTLRFFIIVSGIYIGVLFAQNFRDFTHLGQPLAIHGRYLFPVLPLLFAIVAIAFSRTLHAVPLPKLSLPARKAALATALLAVLVFEGGGFVTYILRSDPTWFWPQSSPAQRANANVKKILKPFVVDTQKK